MDGKTVTTTATNKEMKEKLQRKGMQEGKKKIIN